MWTSGIVTYPLGFTSIGGGASEFGSSRVAAWGPTYITRVGPTWSALGWGHGRLSYGAFLFLFFCYFSVIFRNLVYVFCNWDIMGIFVFV